MRRLPSVLLVVALTSCSSGPEPEARFVHVVLPGIPVEARQTASSPADPGASLSAVLETAAQLPGTDELPDFNVVVGLPRTAVPAAGRDSVVAGVVQTLRRSPARRVLLVLNGAERQDTSIWAAVISSAATAGLALQDLTTCYEADTLKDVGCTFDVEHSRIRMVGFPSLSSTPGAADTAIIKRVAKWVSRLDTLVTRAGAAGKTVVILTDVPDPTLWRSAGVPAAAVTRFNTTLSSRPVAAVIGVRRMGRGQRPVSDRIVVTPPLVASGPADSVLGFTLVRASDGGSLSTVLFRRRDTAFRFVPEATPATARPAVSRGGGTWDWIRSWLWTLTHSADELAKWGVWSLAFLVAFLTVARLWDVSGDRPGSPTPPDSGGSSDASASGKAAAKAGSTSIPTSTTPSAIAELVSGNLGRAVGAGLSGMLLVTFLDDFWKAAAFNPKALYVVLFIVLFFVFLLASAVFRSFQEAFRHRLAIRTPLWWTGAQATWGAVGRRLWIWVLSYRGTSLVFLDTLFNVLQGRNQLKSAVFTGTILEHYQATLTAAERLRLEVDHAVGEALKNVKGQIRVNVTLQSRDGATLYYVRAAEGSLQRRFDQKTVAWLSVVTSRPMWWVDDWHVKFGDRMLVDNSTDQTRLAGLEKKAFTLKEQFGLRGVLDYKAFIVLPFPFGARVESDRARGAIHISFEKAEQIAELIKNVKVKGPPDYDHWQDLLSPEEPGEKATWIQDPVARSVIRSALHTFEALFAPFDEDFFRNYRAQLRQ